MAVRFRQLNIPRRGRYYFAFGVGLLFVYWLAIAQGPLLAIGGVCFFLSTVIWLAFRDPPAGMEIAEGEWRFFIGRRHWSVPLRDIARVRIRRGASRPGVLSLTFKDGRTDDLPEVLWADPERLTPVLAGRGIAVEG